MWDSNAPLQLLKSMPKKLSKENLEKIQMVIDADKYKNSLVSGFDLCGMYAPFCRGCKKTSIYPCAIAYVNMVKAEGVDVEIDARPLYAPAAAPAKKEMPIEEPIQEEVIVAEAEEEVAVTDEEDIETADEAVDIEEPVEDVEPIEEVEQEVKPVEQVRQQTGKRKIRIAIARKKF